VHEPMEEKNVVEQGFTLIELLVVITILGILAGVVVFAVGGITDRGKRSACLAEVHTVRTAIEAYNAKEEASAYPPAAAAPDATGANTVAKLNAALADPADPDHRFLDNPLTTESPSIKLGNYRYLADGVYESTGTGCPT
jgi:general secretion pathway protein G